MQKVLYTAQSMIYHLVSHIHVQTNVHIYQQTFPESTTNLTPSIVTDVSAILVEIMHFLTPSGATSNTLSCSSIERALCRGRMIQHCVCMAYCLASSMREEISFIPLRKTRRSPRSVAGYCTVGRKTTFLIAELLGYKPRTIELYMKNIGTIYKSLWE